MKYFQILDCSSKLGTCCSDYGLANILDIMRQAVNLIQLVVPIILVVGLAIQFTRMLVSPDDKKGMKTLTNKLIATVVCFLLPTIINIMMGILPETDSFQLAACWKSAKTMREVSSAAATTYIDSKQERALSFLNNPGDYAPGQPGSAGGEGANRLISIALAELGNNENNGSHGKYEDFNGLDHSQPWCAAFVTWCAGQAGFLDSGIIPRYVGCSSGVAWFSNRGEFHLEGSGYTPKAGDIVFYGPGGGQHTGIVESADASNIYTIEGNTSCEGSSAVQCGGSDGVSKKVRARGSYVYGYGTPSY